MKRVIGKIVVLVLASVLLAQVLSVLPVSAQVSASVSVTPIPAYVGSEVTINIEVTPGGVYHLQIVIIKPDETLETIGSPYTNSDGQLQLIYVPSSNGHYEVQVWWITGEELIGSVAFDVGPPGLMVIYNGFVEEGEGNRWASSLVETDDGDFVIAGWCDFPWNIPVGWAVRTDSNGAIEWEKSIPPGYSDMHSPMFQSVVQTSDGGFALAGKVTLAEPYGRNDDDFWFTKLDPYGETVWRAGYDYGGEAMMEQGLYLFENSAGNLVCAGTIYDDPYGLCDLAFDVDPSNGHAFNSWSSLEESAYLEAATLTQDGRLVRVGTSHPTYDPRFIKINVDNALTGAHLYSYTVPDKSPSISFTDMVETSDGGFALVGYTATYDAFLLRLNSDFEEVFFETYEKLGDDIAVGVVETDDGGFAVLARTGPHEGYSDLWLFKTDSAGNMDWDWVNSLDYNDYPSDIVLTSDGGLAITGTTVPETGDTDSAMLVILQPAAGSLTVTNFVQYDENDPTTIPDEPWSYVLGRYEDVVQEFPLAAAGEDAYTVASLELGEYWIAQTHKAGYDTSIYVGENEPVEADWASVTIATNEETQVAFVNALEDQFYGSYTRPQEGSDSGALDYTIPANRPVPIQAAWEVDLWGDNGGLKIDLVTGKPIQILVNLAPTVPIVGHADIHVDIKDANGVIVNSYNKPVSKADYDTAHAKVFILTNPITLSTGFYTLSGSYTVDDTTGDTLTSVPVTVIDTVPLALYYTTLSRSDYGTEPGAAYGEMVQQSNDFVKATFPLNLNTLKSDTGWKTPISGSVPQKKASDPPEKGMSIDCTNIALKAYNAYGKSGISYRGIGIGPMVAGAPYSDYFTYHGRPGAGGVRFAGIKGVVVLDGVWDGVAHELGHTYGLYVPTAQDPTIQEEYLMEQYQPHGKTASGVAVQAGTWATGYDFMSWSHDRNVEGTWVNHDTYEDLFRAMLSSQTPQDPQVLWASGVIYRDPIEGVKMETDTDDFPWYSYYEGFIDELDPNGDFALIFKNELDQQIGDPTRFAAYYTMQIDPAFRVGQDINLEDFGTVPIDFAPFAFATALPTGTDHVEVYEHMKTQPTPLGEVDMENVEPFKYTSSGLSIKTGDTFKSGTTVPIKFQLRDPEGNDFITTATAKIYVAKIIPGQEPVFQPAVSGAAPKTRNLFRYDPAKNNYVFNWDTRGLAKGDWRIKIELDDGNLFVVDVKIK